MNNDKEQDALDILLDKVIRRITKDQILSILNGEVKSITESALIKLNSEVNSFRETLASEFEDALDSLTQSISSTANLHIDAIIKSRTIQVNKVEFDDKTVDVGIQHRKFDELLKMIVADIPAYIYGYPGSGKTEAPFYAAKSLGFDFYRLSLSKTSLESKLVGHHTVDGKYIPSVVRMAYEHGGILCLDEIDNANENALVVLNSLTNGFYTFPDKSVERHEKFRLVATANTVGKGADIRFVGRSKLDASLLSRFGFLEFDVDPDFERAIANNDEWVTYIQQIRQKLIDMNIDHVVSPRASIFGAKALKIFDRQTVENMFIWSGMRPEQRELLRKG